MASKVVPFDYEAAFGQEFSYYLDLWAHGILPIDLEEDEDGPEYKRICRLFDKAPELGRKLCKQYGIAY